MTHALLRLAPLAVALLFCVAPDSVVAQPPPRSVFDRSTEPIQIFASGLGAFTRPISSSNREAQRYFDQGCAHLKQGNADFAALYLGRVKKAADAAKGGFRFHTAKDLLTISAGILEGEMQRMAGDLNGAIQTFRRAAEMQEALAYDEPEPFPFSVFHWLGAALLDARRFEEAEQAYRRELKDHPRNGWSLLGLQQALAGRGMTSPEVDAELVQSWSRADTWIRSSRF